MLVPWGEQAKARIIGLRAAWGSFRSVPKAKAEDTHRPRFLFSRRRARKRIFYVCVYNIIYKPSRREPRSECARVHVAAARGDDVRDLPQSGCYQTDNTHTHQLSFWPPASLTEKRSSSAPDADACYAAIYAFFSLWPKCTAALVRQWDALKYFQQTIFPESNRHSHTARSHYYEQGSCTKFGKPVFLYFSNTS